MNSFCDNDINLLIYKNLDDSIYYLKTGSYDLLFIFKEIKLFIPSHGRRMLRHRRPRVLLHTTIESSTTQQPAAHKKKKNNKKKEQRENKKEKGGPAGQL